MATWGTIWEQMPLQLVDCLPLCSWNHVVIDRERDPRISMPELCLCHHHRNSQLRKQLQAPSLSILIARKEAHSLSRQTLNERFAEVIRATLDAKVVYEDALGEGVNGWGSNPRYPHKRVNCLVCLQLVIREIYGKGLSDKTVVMDRLRYSGGHIGFALGKHYADQWLAFEPEPL